MDNQQMRLNTIIEALEAVQAQAPTKTTYSMGRADHSISNQLLPIIADLKALVNDTTNTAEPTEPVTIQSTAKASK